MQINLLSIPCSPCCADQSLSVNTSFDSQKMMGVSVPISRYLCTDSVWLDRWHAPHARISGLLESTLTLGSNSVRFLLIILCDPAARGPRPNGNVRQLASTHTAVPTAPFLFLYDVWDLLAVCNSIFVLSIYPNYLHDT